MKIGDEIDKDKYLEQKKKENNEGGPQFEKQEWTEKTAGMLGKDYVYTATKMKGWSAKKMRERYKKAQRDGEPPAALWWYLYNQEKDSG